MAIKPRNDFALIRVIMLDTNERGIAIPQGSMEGKQYLVEAIGPKVEGLKVGDRVLMVGQMGEDWGYLPGTKELLVLKESNVVLIYAED